MSAETLTSSQKNQLPQHEQHEAGGDYVHFRGFDEASRARKNIRDEFIIDALNGSLMVGNEEAQFIKRYFDKQPADQTDKAFTHDPEAVAGFHDDLADLLTSRLKIFAPGAGDDVKTFLLAKKDEFFQKIADGRQQVRDFAHGWSQTGQGRAPSAALEFRGLNVPTAEGDINLLDKPAGNVKANFHVQAEMTGSFIHWSSKEYLKMKDQGQDPGLTRRIYLNPTAESTVEIFGKIIDAAEEAGIVMKGKLLNRGVEALANMKNTEFSTRGDGIVLSAGEGADELLSLVEAVYNDHRGDFEGRGISRAPFRVAEGVAIADEPRGEGSLTDTRAELVDDTVKATKGVLGVEPWEDIPIAKQAQAVQVFRTNFRQLALQRGINPDNMSFNLQVA